MLDNAQATVTVGPLHQHAEAAPQLRDGFGRWHAVVDLRRARGVERYLEQAPAVVQLLQVEPRLGVVDPVVGQVAHAMARLHQAPEHGSATWWERVCPSG